MQYTVEITIEDGYDIEAKSLEEAESLARTEAEERYTGTGAVFVQAFPVEI